MAGTNVMGGINAVLGAPQRAVAGALTGDIGATVTPFDEQRQVALEQRTEALPGVHQAAETVGEGAGLVGKLSDEIMHAVGHPTHNEQFLGRVGKVFAAQAITDPLTYVPLIGEAKMANTARSAWELAAKSAEAVGSKVPGLTNAAKAAKEYHEGLIQPFMHKVFATRPGLDPFLDEHGKAARLSIEEKNIDLMREEGQRQNDMARKYESQIRNAKTFADLPPEVRQESMREAWRYGTPDMRAKVESDSRFGFQPTHEDREKFPQPLGLVKYDPRKDYVTLISPKPPKSYADMELFQGYGEKKKQEFAGFEKHARPDEQVHEDMYERILNRWKLGRNVLRQRMTDADTKNYLLQYGGSRIPASAENVDAIVRQLDHSPKRYDIPGWTETSRRLARGGIQLNPLPHGLKNVGDLAELAGGPEAFGKGLAYAAKGLSDSQLTRLKGMGVSIDYLRDAQGPITYIANKLGQQKLLQRMELGYRQARLDQLDKELGESAGDLSSEYDKAQRIRDDLGDYRNISRFTAALQALGGPFVAFRTSITPRAVARAATRAPQRVEARARASEDVNQELHREGQPGTFHYGGPVEDAARMVFKPGDYLTSPATIGPLVSAALKTIFEGKSPIQEAKQAGEGYIPAWQEIVPALKAIPGAAEWLQKQGLTYREPPGLSQMNDALNLIFGSHFEMPTSQKRRRDIEYETRQ